jgi:hypothetical protein
MKANAPEKIYLSKDLFRWSFGKASDKSDIEYTRTDAFIDKAEKYLLEHLIDYWSQGVTDETDFIEAFRNYMKGE